jgi:hypothetical protein
VCYLREKYISWQTSLCSWHWNIPRKHMFLSTEKMKKLLECFLSFDARNESRILQKIFWRMCSESASWRWWKLCKNLSRYSTSIYMIQWKMHKMYLSDANWGMKLYKNVALFCILRIKQLVIDSTWKDIFKINSSFD